MRKKNEKQMSLTPPTIDHPKAKELEAISFILDQNDTILDLVNQDLSTGQVRAKGGATGMTAEQVLRAALIKQINGYTYRDLAFHIADSDSIRSFMRIGFGDRAFKSSTLHDNISKITPQTWEAINLKLIEWAQSEKIDKGRQVRMDCTVVETNIHHPTDSSLLYDCVRVLTRLLQQINRLWDGIHFQSHNRRAKRRALKVLNAKNKSARIVAYKDLIKVTTKTIGYAEKTLEQLQNINTPETVDYTLELVRYISLGRRVIQQTTIRVLEEKQVPASEKVVSIFEPHTDVIVKDRRDTYYGHKVCFSVGVSQLITDCVITKGNPADTSLVEEMLDRQKEIYGRYPLKAAFDGGFASKPNLNTAKAMGIKDVCFAKKRGLEVEDMCRSEWVYKRLRNFRAGVESVISWLKRSLGLTRCTWKGVQAFGRYVWLSVVSANLRILARHHPA
jgi:IS5 family transposase